MALLETRLSNSLAFKDHVRSTNIVAVSNYY